jgi:probable F420-dependent oxidoreductase
MTEAPTPRPFRFGVVVAQAADAAEWTEKARKVEALGYDVFLMPDGISHLMAPFPALMAAAAATSRLHVGTYVLANDFRNPLLVAQEAATLQFLSDGRFELGLGAGRPDAAAENRMLGLPFETGGVRVARLGASARIVKGLLAGEDVTAPGPYYANADAALPRDLADRPAPPLLIAGSGRSLLMLAGREADIVGLGLAPTATDAEAEEKIGWVRTAAGDRFDRIELNLNLLAINGRAPRWIAARLDLAVLARSGAVAFVAGSADEIADQLRRRRATLGISYYNVAEDFMDDFAPVVERLAGR